MRYLLILLVAGLLCQPALAEPAPSFQPASIDLPDDSAEPGIAFQTHATGQVEWVYHKTADGSHPSGIEQQFVWLMNRARVHPWAEGNWLANSNHSRVESAIRYFSVDLGVLTTEFYNLNPKPPAAFDRRLYEAALSHSLYLISADAQNHNNQFDRITDAGFRYRSGNGSVFSYAQDGVYGHAGFNIDWGNGTPDGMQTGRGHRVGLMDSSGRTLSNVGVVCVEERDSSTRVGPWVTTINYCRANTSQPNHFNRFIVGTVWQDLDQNGRYDPGEGLGGVEVRPDSGGYYAITGDHGGYAIPILASGTYAVTFAGGELGRQETKSVTVGSSSVLLDLSDYELDPNSLAEVLRVDPSMVRWNGISGAVSYFERSGDFQNWTPERFMSYYNEPGMTFEAALSEGEFGRVRFVGF